MAKELELKSQSLYVSLLKRRILFKNNGNGIMKIIEYFKWNRKLNANKAGFFVIRIFSSSNVLCDIFVNWNWVANRWQ
jgi:hypothetical protein